MVATPAFVTLISAHVGAGRESASARAWTNRASSFSGARALAERELGLFWIDCWSHDIGKLLAPAMLPLSGGIAAKVVAE
jgi:hypothetical protein